MMPLFLYSQRRLAEKLFTNACKKVCEIKEVLWEPWLTLVPEYTDKNGTGAMPASEDILTIIPLRLRKKHMYHIQCAYVLYT